MHNGDSAAAISVAAATGELRAKWEPEQEEELKRLWTGGSSASQIAKTMNEKFRMALSRNAVIGKVHRLKLESRKGISRASKGEKKPRAPRGASRRRIRLPPNSDCGGGAYTRPVIVPENAKHLSFMDLQTGQCRYPFGEGPSYTFCGQDTIKESSYCEACHAVTHQPNYSGPPTRAVQTPQAEAA